MEPENENVPTTLSGALAGSILTADRGLVFTSTSFADAGTWTFKL